MMRIWIAEKSKQICAVGLEKDNVSLFMMLKEG